MRFGIVLILAVGCSCVGVGRSWALDEFDRHTSKLLKEAAEKNDAVDKLSSGQATKLKTIGPRIEHACIIIRTDEGNWAKALVSWGFRKKPGGEKEADGGKAREGLVPILVLERYVTYDRDRGDQTLAHGRNIMLFPGYEFDFDIGQIVPTDSGADLKFTAERALQPLGKARLHPLDGSVLPPPPADKYDPHDHVDVRPRDFAGNWRVNADGRWVGTWEIEVDDVGNVTGRYTSEETKGSFPIRGRITETEIRHRLRFEIEFAVAAQMYDMYLWTTDKSKMAGTTTLISRTFGVVAERVPAGAPAAKTDGAKTSARERLKKPVMLGEITDSLEQVLATLAKECGVTIRISGPDLQAEGITKNKRITVNARDKAADAVLREALLIADSSKQLVYVLRKDGDGEYVEITTRRKVAARGDRLPRELLLPLAARLKETVAFQTPRKQPIDVALERFSQQTQIGVLVRGGDGVAEDGSDPPRVAINAEGQPAGDVVRQLLKAAYGDQAIYVFANVDGEEYLVVTTRTAAEQRGEKIPAEFPAPKS